MSAITSRLRLSSPFVAFGLACLLAGHARALPIVENAEKETKKAAADLFAAASRDYQSQSITRRWAVVLVGVLGDADSSALAAGLHAALTIKTRFSWKGARWKFVVESHDPLPMEVQLISSAVDLGANVADEIIKVLGGVSLTRESIVCQVVAVPMSGAQPMWILVGARKSAKGSVTPIFRVESGNVETIANVLRELMSATQAPK